MRHNKIFFQYLLVKVRAQDLSLSTQKITKTITRVAWVMGEYGDRDKTSERLMMSALLRHPHLEFKDWESYCSHDFGAAVENPMLDLWLLEGVEFGRWLRLDALAMECFRRGREELAGFFLRRHFHRDRKAYRPPLPFRYRNRGSKTFEA